MKILLWGTVALATIGVVGGAAVYFGQNSKNTPLVTNFAECEAAGYSVMESYPRQCRTPDGELFAEDIGNELEKADLIRVHSPRPNQVISSPLRIEGEARGPWFFEASFPVRLFDEQGNEIPLDPPYVMTTEEGMTEDFVAFEATIEFAAPASGRGTLIFQKDNPSGLPEHDDQLIMPVRFGALTTNRAKNGCIITGCSSQVCAKEEVITTCELRPEYACYTSAVCERQANGECGWTQTPELQECLVDPGKASQGFLP